jgi:hypothetical protein
VGVLCLCEGSDFIVAAIKIPATEAAVGVK